MNLLDLKTPLSRLPRDKVIDFIRELRYQRTLDHSPPKKEKVKKEKKNKVPKGMLKLLEDPEQMSLFLQMIEEEKANDNKDL